MTKRISFKQTHGFQAQRLLIAVAILMGFGCSSKTSDSNEGVPPSQCPVGSVCGTGEAVVCEGPAWFAGDPADSACTAVAFCPKNAVCGSGLARVCSPEFNFAASPLDLSCTLIGNCPQAAQCEIDGVSICSAECSLASYKITSETSPTRESPWVPEEDTALVVSGREDAEVVTNLAQWPALMAAHPARQSVPGILPDNVNFVRKAVRVNLSNTGKNSAYWYSSPGAPVWRSTGLFARAGSVVTVEIEGEALAASTGGLEIQVGSHNDTENVWGFPYGQPIRRFPEIVHRWPLDNSIIAFTSAFGGLVYVRVPEGSGVGETEVTITGATPAPLYVHGVTDIAEWNDTLRKYPAPWAELMGDKVVLTVRSSDIRELDVVPLMDFWTRAMDAAWYLAGVGDEGHRIERYAADPAIEGIAHSGYPVAMAEQWSAALLDVTSQGQNNWWTTFHELGHNFQFAPWTWTGLQEASCNLWALYVLEEAAGLEWHDTHPGEEMGQVKRTQRIQTYVDGGRHFTEEWQTGFNAYQGFLPLEVFMQLVEGFGWELIHALNQEYSGLSELERPYLSHDKIQRWVRASSLMAGVNLEEFYLDWGFPIDEATASSIAHLPAWDSNPMSQFD